MRGRQSVNPLNKLGFSIAREREGNIIITELGNHFINGSYDTGYIFFKSLLKLQFPNPWSKHFSAGDGFDVQPFLAVMHLIKKINNTSKENGLTKTEFSLFVPSLINYNLLDYYTKKILDYRKTKNKEKFINDFAKEFYKTNNPSKKQINNFFEYGDNIMRYFRLTRYFKVSTDSFGADWRIDLEPIRRTEIEQILEKYTGKAKHFERLDDYLIYISDISLPQLPSENVVNLKESAQSLIIAIKKYAKDNSLTFSDKQKILLEIDFSNFTKEDLNHLISELRELNLELNEKLSRLSLYSDFSKIQNVIEILKNYKDIKKLEPEQFEKVITDALKFINDEIKIKPNYPVDDSGEPISHASGNQPDIECYYESYNAICEVTLDISNFQWVRESQPVMRHLRDFEKKYPKTQNYCLFISPKIHIDTLYHFWTSIKYGYDGSKQNIIPITTEQFATLLETSLLHLKKGRRFSHTDIEKLYIQIILKTNTVSGHTEWFSNITSVIDEWKQFILAL